MVQLGNININKERMGLYTEHTQIHIKCKQSFLLDNDETFLFICSIQNLYNKTFCTYKQQVLNDKNNKPQTGLGYQ